MAARAAFGGLVLATGLARDPARAQLADEHLEGLVAELVLLGAEPVVVVHDGTPRLPPSVRGLRMPRAERDDLSALRLGLLQFTNAPVDAAVVVPIEAHALGHATLRRLVDDSRRRQARMAALARGGTLGFPLFVMREAWRELLTTEGGLDAILRLQGPALLALEVDA
jgi:hypothetical protein